MNDLTDLSIQELEDHAKKWTRVYKQRYHTLYEDFARSLHDYLGYELRVYVKNHKGLKYHKIEGREKEPKKFYLKVMQVAKNDKSCFKYPDPFCGNIRCAITDLAGSRIILYYLNDISIIDEFIYERFEVVEKVDKFQDLENAEKFGYQGVHYIVKVDSKTNITGKDNFKDLFAEIQVKTILEHAWAEMEHDFYDLRKYSENLQNESRPIKRRFHSLAGLLEIADREFQSLRDMKKKLKNGNN